MHIVAGMYLFVQGIWDMKIKKIPLWISLGFGIFSFFYSVFCQREWISFWTALIPGGICLLLSRCTREEIGYGDGVLLCSLGMFYTLEELLCICMSAFLFAGAAGLILLLFLKKSRKFELPFVPFIFLGWVIVQGIRLIDGGGL